MTKKELSQVYYLDKEIKRDKERLKELQAKAYKITQDMGGMPSSRKKSDKVGQYAVEIAEQKSLIQEKIRKCIYLQNRILRYINSIDDSLIRQILTERYIELKSWRQIAFIVGGGNTEESVRKIHDRFIKRQKAKA